MGFLWYIIIGIAAGFLAGKIMRGGGFGVIINLCQAVYVIFQFGTALCFC